MNQEIILKKEDVELLVSEMSRAISIQDCYQIKMRFIKNKITIIPHCNPREIDVDI